jgi:hypothetical protein
MLLDGKHTNKNIHLGIPVAANLFLAATSASSLHTSDSIAIHHLHSGVSSS